MLYGKSRIRQKQLSDKLSISSLYNIKLKFNAWHKMAQDE